MSMSQEVSGYLKGFWVMGSFEGLHRSQKKDLLRCLLEGFWGFPKGFWC